MVALQSCVEISGHDDHAVLPVLLLRAEDGRLSVILSSLPPFPVPGF